MGLIASLFLKDDEEDKSNATEIMYDGVKIKLDPTSISQLVCRYPFCGQYSES